MIVCKFGGSSSACKHGVDNILEIVKNKNRKIIVFSAIGKFGKYDTKLTDLLIELVEGKKTLNLIDQKFENLAKNLNINFNYKRYTKRFVRIKNYDKLLSRGEFLTAKMFAKATNIKFLDAKKLLFAKKECFCENEIKKKIDKILHKYDQIIVPGFYFLNNKKITIFSRGGGDISGAYFALFSDAKKYEIWTDVPGVYNKNPQKYGAKIFKKITYSHMLQLSKKGAQVVHPDACLILKNSGIKSIVKSTFLPKAKGTIIQ